MKPVRARLASLLLSVTLVATLVGACGGDGGTVDVTITDGDDTTRVETAGFFSGLGDGFVAPFTGVASLFGDVEVYDDAAGDAYPLGFGLGLILIIALLSGLFAGPRYVRRRRY